MPVFTLYVMEIYSDGEQGLTCCLWQGTRRILGWYKRLGSVGWEVSTRLQKCILGIDASNCGGVILWENGEQIGLAM